MDSCGVRTFLLLQYALVFATCQVFVPEDTNGDVGVPQRDTISLEDLLHGIIKGERGPIGPRGRKGEKGNVGPVGPRGAEGVRGQRGHKGDTGETGQRGPKGGRGYPGFPGSPGAKGDHGAPGDPGIGLQGPGGHKGEQGEIGRRGQKGGIGEQGPAGLPGADGIPGTNGKPGPKGERGAPGAVTRIQGFPGEKGNRGDAGPPGQDGSTGRHGRKGDIGPVGPRGEKGQQGDKGSQGPPGPQGQTVVVSQAAPKSVFSEDEAAQLRQLLSTPPKPGPPGPPGVAGPVGPMGARGFPGEKGEVRLLTVRANGQEVPPDAISELYQQWAQLQQQITWMSQLLTAGALRQRPARTCRDVLASGIRQSGTYWLDPSGSGNPANAFLAFCDLTTDGGGWTLVYSYTFTRSDSFTAPDNDVIPIPTWPLLTQSRTPKSRVAPIGENALGAVTFSKWSLIGREFLVKSNIGDWIACNESNQTGHGSLVAVKSGGVNCRLIKKVLDNCQPLMPRYLRWNRSSGPALLSGAGERTLLQWEALRTYTPSHNICSFNVYIQFIARVVVPYGGIYIR